MTPQQFLARIKKREIAPAYLFQGSEAYWRTQCREALIAAMLGNDDREQGLTQHDLAETSLAEVVDDARALSLFAPQRVIIATSAEAALPKAGKAEEDESDGPSRGSRDAGELAAYLKRPSPGVVLVFESTRFDLDGEDKKKQERVTKFYSAIPDVVEFARFSTDEATAETRRLAARMKVPLDAASLELLVEALGAEMSRIAIELEKLSLYSGDGRTLTAEDIGALIPDARSTTTFALVNALGRRDRGRALLMLDTLIREGEYLPLSLAFLSTQMRMALIAKESGLRTPQQIQGHFQKAGVPVWGSRAEQVYQTMSKFSSAQLARSLKLIFEADRDLRSARPDDRVVMEKFVVSLTA